MGAVGADELGDEALAELAGEGIDVDHVARLDGVATGVAAIVVDESGENQIAVASGANAQIDAGAVENALAALLTTKPEGSDPLGSGVVLLGNEVPEAAVAAGLRAASAAGWLVVLNPAPARPAGADLGGVILTPNADEARELAGKEDVEAAARVLAERTGAAVLVTLGADGALLLDGGEAQRLPAPPVDVVDTTGAGDTVNGALAAELAAGRPLAEAVQFALAAAALSTTAAGARTGMPRRDEVPASL